jgi:hypothetical protein
MRAVDQMIVWLGKQPISIRLTLAIPATIIVFVAAFFCEEAGEA